MSKYLKIIDKFKNKKILVVGDFILDKYIYGITERISREAPVLILKYDKTEYLAGGGANPVLNIKDLGGIPVPISLVGEDSNSQIVLNILKEKGINTTYILKEEGYKIPVKTRILAGDIHTAKQQIIRIDEYSKNKISKEIEDKIINNIKILLNKIDAILVSDYGDGILTDKIIKFINKIALNKKVIVDSRYSLVKFKNITAATPNETEAGPVVKIEDYSDEGIKKIAKLITKKIKSKGIIITRGSNGMFVYENNKYKNIEVFGSREIVDVSGAGDTVASIVALSLSCGCSLYDSAVLANIGGGIVVMKRGVATVSMSELKRGIKKWEKLKKGTN